MALTHLVDTSALKRLHHPPAHDRIDGLAVVGQLARPTICDLEVGFSARNESEWDALTRALKIFDLIETTTDDGCLLYTSPSPRNRPRTRMPSSS